MNNPLRKKPTENINWTTALVACLVCAHRWVAVYPIGLTRLQCPNCANFSEVEIIQTP